MTNFTGGEYIDEKWNGTEKMYYVQRFKKKNKYKSVHLNFFDFIYYY